MKPRNFVRRISNAKHTKGNCAEKCYRSNSNFQCYWHNWVRNWFSFYVDFSFLLGLKASQTSRARVISQKACRLFEAASVIVFPTNAGDLTPQACFELSCKRQHRQRIGPAIKVCRTSVHRSLWFRFEPQIRRFSFPELFNRYLRRACMALRAELMLWFVSDGICWRLFCVDGNIWRVNCFRLQS